MKTKEIAIKYGIDKIEFEEYLQKNKLGRSSFSGYILDDKIQEHVEVFIEKNDLMS